MTDWRDRYNYKLHLKQKLDELFKNILNSLENGFKKFKRLYSVRNCDLSKRESNYPIRNSEVLKIDPNFRFASSTKRFNKIS